MHVEPADLNRRYRRSSDPMIAVWCLLDHVSKRYCLESAVLIDNFGRELVAAGDRWHVDAPVNDEGAPLIQRHQATTLPGRALPGLIVVRGDEVAIEAAFQDIQHGLHRIFYGEERPNRDDELALKSAAYQSLGTF